MQKSVLEWKQKALPRQQEPVGFEHGYVFAQYVEIAGRHCQSLFRQNKKHLC